MTLNTLAKVISQFFKFLSNSAPSKTTLSLLSTRDLLLKAIWCSAGISSLVYLLYRGAFWVRSRNIFVLFTVLFEVNFDVETHIPACFGHKGTVCHHSKRIWFLALQSLLLLFYIFSTEKVNNRNGEANIHSFIQPYVEALQKNDEFNKVHKAKWPTIWKLYPCWVNDWHIMIEIDFHLLTELLHCYMERRWCGEPLSIANRPSCKFKNGSK